MARTEGLRAVLDVAVVLAVQRHIDAQRLVIDAIATVDAIKGYLGCRMFAIVVLCNSMQSVSSSVHAT